MNHEIHDISSPTCVHISSVHILLQDYVLYLVHIILNSLDCRAVAMLQMYKIRIHIIF
jgi:hypothetical protein